MIKSKKSSGKFFSISYDSLIIYSDSLSGTEYFHIYGLTNSIWKADSLYAKIIYQNDYTLLKDIRICAGLDQIDLSGTLPIKINTFKQCEFMQKCLLDLRANWQDIDPASFIHAESGTSFRLPRAGKISIAAQIEYPFINCLITFEKGKFILPNNFLPGIQLIQTDIFLNLKGSIDSLKYIGHISVIEGEIDYFGRKFCIEHGLVLFSNKPAKKSEIELLASTKIHSYESADRCEYEILLTLAGDYNNPILKLTSEPALTARHIRALLAVGRTREGIFEGIDTTSNKNLQQKLAAQAKRLNNKTLIQFTERRVGRMLSLEKVTIEGNLFNFSRNGPRLIAQKRLAKRLDLFYHTVVGHANEQHVKLEYKLMRHLSLEGETDQVGRSGIDFKIKYRFK